MESNHKTVVGIDVAKDTLSISIFDGGKHEYLLLDYNEKAIKKELIQRFKNFQDLVVFVMEATGVYHTRIAYWLHSSGLSVAIVNPLVIKRYAQMRMSRVKTDKFDCTIIAEYGYKEELVLFKPKSQETLQLGLLLKTIEDFLAQKSILVSQRHALRHQANCPKDILAFYDKHIEFINKEIVALKKKMKLLLQEEFKSQYELLSSIKGIGVMSSAMIISLFDSFEHFENAKQASSFIGITPVPYESGTSVKRKGSISKQGNTLARKLLYMASLSGVQSNALLKPLYERLLEKGKSKKQALIAVAHKLLRIAFGVLKNNRPFCVDYCGDKKIAKVC